jgi:uncharacterized protein YpmS
MMQESNFWYYIFFTIIMLHLIVGVIYIMIKLKPRNKKNGKK